MFQRMIQRARREDAGFTLIELMVVVLIIAILIAIAIPTFLGARKRAQDRAAQSSIRNILTAAKTVFTDRESFSGVTVATLGASEPSICVTDGATSSTGADCADDVSNGPNGVVFKVSSGAQLVVRAVAYSKSGNCFALEDVEGPTTSTTGLGVTYKKIPPTGVTCTEAMLVDTDAHDISYTPTGWQ